MNKDRIKNRIDEINSLKSFKELRITNRTILMLLEELVKDRRRNCIIIEEGIFKRCLRICGLVVWYR